MLDDLWQRGRAALMVVLIGLTLLSSVPSVGRTGDRLQIMLPLLALGCSVATGGAGEFLWRFGGMWVSAHAAKQLLPVGPLTRRPAGGAHGFPSAHTAAAALGASAIIHDCVTRSPMARVVTLGAAAFVGASRIEVQAHDIWQVFSGALLGFGWERGLRCQSGARRGLLRLLAGLGAALAGVLRGRIVGGSQLTGAVAAMEGRAAKAVSQAARAGRPARQSRSGWRKPR